MPRPSIGLVYNKNSRTSRKLEDPSPPDDAPVIRTSSPAKIPAKFQNVQASEPSSSSSEPLSSVPSSNQDNSSEKRIRKPSKRMLEALKSDLKPAAEGPSRKRARESQLDSTVSKSRPAVPVKDAPVFSPSEDQQELQPSFNQKSSVVASKASNKPRKSETKSSSRVEEDFEFPEPIAPTPAPLAEPSKKPRKKRSSTKIQEPLLDTVSLDFPPEIPPEIAADDFSAIAADSPAPSLSLSIDERRLTARQRAKLYGTQEHLMKLEDPQPKSVADFQEKREEKNRKRREQAAQKREELKIDTLQKLTKNTGTGKRGAREVSDANKAVIRYVLNADGGRIIIPLGIPVDEVIPTLPRRPPPVVVRCGVDGCKNVKKYNCSKTGTPFCSLLCYQKLSRT